MTVQELQLIYTMRVAFLVASMVLSVVQVPALCIFGDSVVDVGNNNHLLTLMKANFPPYGRDFIDHRTTGRFCNGKLATDFTADYLGLDSYPPAYLGQKAKGSNILNGVNFASAAYYDQTAQLYIRARSIIYLIRHKSKDINLNLCPQGALSLMQECYKDWQRKVVDLIGKAKVNTIFSEAIHLISAGSSDFLQNYYINPILRIHSLDHFSDMLMKSYSTLIQNLYSLGARRIGVTTLPPTGYLPAAITLFGAGSNQCVARLNQDAAAFNDKLNITSQYLKTKLPGLKLVVFDIYHPLLDMITNPSDSGFFEPRKACCGTGIIETSFLCNSRSVGTCSNATEYLFWDGFHPSEAANEKLAQELLVQGFDLIS